MSKNKISIIACFLFLLSLNIFLKPYLEQREVIKIVRTVLTCWQKGDLPSVYALWKNPEKSPPVYGLISYKIKNKYFGKREKISYAQVSTMLEFTTDNIAPSEKEWMFELEKGNGSWKIIDFHLIE